MLPKAPSFATGHDIQAFFRASKHAVPVDGAYLLLSSIFVYRFLSSGGYSSENAKEPVVRKDSRKCNIWSGPSRASGERMAGALPRS